jgi:PP-loop superfamily ATP-utilizing enzyme
MRYMRHGTNDHEVEFRRDRPSAGGNGSERSEQQRCSTCVLPTSTRGLRFNAQGECQLCQKAKAAPVGRRASGANEVDLQKQIDELKERGRGRPFDCVVGVSGGRDSSYLLYLLVRKHQLRCLAAYYRTPFTSEVTDANVRRMITDLGVPLVEMNISKDYHRRIARNLVRLWNKKPHEAIANLACAPCKLVNREVFKIARDHKVRSIVNGVNRFEMMQFTAAQSTTTDIATVRLASLTEQVRRTLRVIGRGAVMLRRYPTLLRYVPIGFQASVMYVGFHTPYLRLRYSDIHALNYFYYADWTEAACEAALVQLGWQLPPGCNSTWKTDCSFAELKNCMFRRTVGVAYVDTFFSNMVREGLLGREEALVRLETSGRVSHERLADTYRILGLSEGERAFELPNPVEASRETV